VDEEKGRTVKVYGIAGGLERFSKDFELSDANGLNSFLESGLFADDTTHTSYTWSPDKIDLSIDVVKMLEEPQTPRKEPEMVVEQKEMVVEQKEMVVEEVPAPTPVLVEEVAEPEPVRPVMTVPEQKPAKPAVSQAEAASEEVLLGKLSYIQPGDEYQKEGVRISKLLRKFRWNTEPPYVIGAMFDNLVSVQSQTGMIKASAIEAITKLGYTFVAIEAPSGTVTAWFRKQGEADEPDEPLEFGR
jgi:hypothetical protein